MLRFTLEEFSFTMKFQHFFRSFLIKSLFFQWLTKCLNLIYFENIFHAFFYLEWREKKLFKKTLEAHEKKDWANGRKYLVWFIRWEFLKAQLFRFYDEYYHFSRLIILTVDGSSTLSWLRWSGGRTKISIRMISILCNCSGQKWEQRKWNKKKNLVAFFQENWFRIFGQWNHKKKKKIMRPISRKHASVDV